MDFCGPFPDILCVFLVGYISSVLMESDNIKFLTLQNLKIHLMIDILSVPDTSMINLTLRVIYFDKLACYR